MTRPKEYIYICEKCGNNISSSVDVIICEICGNKIDGNYSSWSNNSSKEKKFRPSLFNRGLNKVYSFFGGLPIKWKIILFFASLLTFLLFPIEIIDLFPFLFLGITSVITFAFLINLKLWKYVSIFKSALVNALIFFIIFFLLIQSHSYRRERLLDMRGHITSGYINEIKIRYGKHSHVHIAIYTYYVNRKKMQGKEILFDGEAFKIWQKQNINVKYVEGRPRISKIYRK